MAGIESVWTGESPAHIATRALLLPFAALYRAGSGARNWMYDRAVLSAEDSAIPVVSVGNISVGGTGKTPFSAWIARQLVERGATPAIILRGYGADEPQVHRLLNPDVPLIVSPSRVDGIRRAATRGANVAVLDDAFQHRRARRNEDIVLISADAWTDNQRVLPAGPWREPLSAITRASLIVITRKAVGAVIAQTISDVIRRTAPAIPQATVLFGLDELHIVSAGADNSDSPRELTRELVSLAGKTVLAIAAVGDNAAFFAQLEERGISVERAPFPDHHQFTADDAAALAHRARHAHAAVCTLKDAVKLGDLWPAGSAPLWYVSQSIALEGGASEIERALTRILTLAGQREKRETTRPNRPPDQNPT